MKNTEEDTLDFGFLAFNKDQIDEILVNVGLHFNKSGYLRTKNNIPKHCDCCGHSLKKNNIGSILPGSNIIYCDNPVCYTEYMDKILKL